MDRCLITRPDLVLRREEDGGLLFDPRTGEIHVLSGTGVFVVDLFDGRHTREQIVSLLMENYAIPERSKAEQDVDEFIATMRDAQLIGEAV